MYLSSKCKTLDGKYTFKCFLPNNCEEDQQVCQTFFVATLGYTNDKVIRVLRSLIFEDRVGENGEVRKVRKLVPPPDMRGRQSPANKLSEEKLAKVHAHINSLRSRNNDGVTMSQMFQDFCEQYPNVCSRSRYIQELKKFDLDFQI